MTRKKPDPFAAYRLPKAFTAGVEIPLAGTDAKFTVILPSEHNEEYQMRVMQSLSTGTTIDEEAGTIRNDIDITRMRKARRDAFFDVCILSATGLPDGQNAADFFAEFQLAATHIHEKADELADAEDTAVKEALEKLNPTPDGNSSGAGKRSNTKTLSKQE